MDEQYKKAKLSAIRFLGFRSQTVAEMQQKLTRQGFDQRTVLQVVNELRNTGYLNDERFTQEFIRYQLMRKPMGRFLMTAKLKEHGVSEDVINRIIARELSEDKEKELALAVAEGKKKELRIKLAKLSSLQKQKIGQYLSSRGFASDIIWETIDLLDKGGSEW